MSSGPGQPGGGGGGGGGGYNPTAGGSYGSPSPWGNTNWPTGPTTGGGAGAGGYNPQLMQGQGNDTVFQGGTPFWQPWTGWNEMAGTSSTPQGNFDAAAQATPGAPQWLQHQYGDYLQQPFYTNPNQYGRFNWATNMQGGGIPSPFGQYAQQTATYPALNFPPPPQNNQGGGPGSGPVPPMPPQPPGGGGSPGGAFDPAAAFKQMIAKGDDKSLLTAYMGLGNSDLRNKVLGPMMLAKYGGQEGINQLINSNWDKQGSGINADNSAFGFWQGQGFGRTGNPANAFWQAPAAPTQPIPTFGAPRR